MELLEHKILLEKYFEGNTSKEEEKQLKRFLSSYQGNEIDLLEAKDMFAVQIALKQEKVAIEFEDFIAKADAITIKPSKVRRMYIASLAVAAIVVTVMSLVFVLNSKSEPVVYAYIDGQAITDKAEALQYSQEALKIMSTNINKGTQNLSYMKQLNKPAALITAQ